MILQATATETTTDLTEDQEEGDQVGKEDLDGDRAETEETDWE